MKPNLLESNLAVSDMKKTICYTVGLAFIVLAACKREEYWNQTTAVPHASISGALTNTDDNIPFKGVKILFERQTKANGEQTFVDTVATDEKGQFKYEVPYPNKVKVSVRDTGRYQLDEAFVEVKDQKDYPVALKSFPRFGMSKIKVTVADRDSKSPIEEVNVSLLVKESAAESYSLVETKSSNTGGTLEFEQIAFPVRYKIRVAEDALLYDLDSLEGRLLRKEPLELSLAVKKKFGKGDIKLQSMNYYLGTAVKNETVSVQYKSIRDSEFQTAEDYTLDEKGLLILKNVTYPGEVRISALKNAIYPFSTAEVSVAEENTTLAKSFTIFDLAPRATHRAPSAVSAENSVETLLDGYALLTMELDSKQNIWAVTTNNQLIKVTPEGQITVVAGIGGTSMPDGYDPTKEVGDGHSVHFNKLWGLGMVDDNTIYVTENDGIHLIKKITVDPQTGASKVSIFSGTAKKSGTTDGDISAALYNRPADIAYSKKENCLYVSEWTGARIRKIDLKTNNVTTLATGSGVGYAFGISLSTDEKSIYIAAHTNAAGIKRLDLSTNSLSNIKIADVPSPRHVVVTPDDRIFYTVNNVSSGQSLLTITNPATGASAVVAGSGSGSGVPVGTKVDANTNIFAMADPGVSGLIYDAFRGRLYVASPANNKLYFVRLKSLY